MQLSSPPSDCLLFQTSPGNNPVPSGGPGSRCCDKNEELQEFYWGVMPVRHRGKEAGAGRPSLPTAVQIRYLCKGRTEAKGDAESLKPRRGSFRVAAGPMESSRAECPREESGPKTCPVPSHRAGAPRGKWGLSADTGRDPGGEEAGGRQLTALKQVNGREVRAARLRGYHVRYFVFKSSSRSVCHLGSVFETYT